MQRYIFTQQKRCRSWFLPASLLFGVLITVAAHFSAGARETHVAGLTAHVGFSGDWSRRFAVGQSLQLSPDRSMPLGYERIYLQQFGEIIGSLPESPLAMQVRKALVDRQPVQVRIVSVDPLDPARGVRVRISFEQMPETSALVARAF